MEKRLENGVQVDEYFNLGDAVFIARTTIYYDGNFDPVDKYYIIDGAVYIRLTDQQRRLQRSLISTVTTGAAKDQSICIFLSMR